MEEVIFMEMEEKIGAILLVLLVFSLAVSLIPVTVKHEAKWNQWLPGLFTQKGVFNREISSKSITLIVDFGQIDVTSDPGIKKPYVDVEGTMPTVENGQVVRMAAGHVILHLPDSWKGELKVKVGMGALALREPFLSNLSVNIGMGEVKGTAYSSGNVNIRVDRGSVKLTLNVPKDVRVHARINSIEGSLYYDGKSIEGSMIERTFGEGKKTIEVNIYSYSAEVDIRTWRD